MTIRNDHKLYRVGGIVVEEERILFDTYLERYFGLMVPADAPLYLGGGLFTVRTKK